MKTMQDFIDMKNHLLDMGLSNEEVLKVLQESLASIEEMIEKSKWEPDINNLKSERIYLISIINAHKYNMEHPAEQIKILINKNGQFTAA